MNSKFFFLKNDLIFSLTKKIISARLIFLSFTKNQEMGKIFWIKQTRLKIRYFSRRSLTLPVYNQSSKHVQTKVSSKMIVLIVNQLVHKLLFDIRYSDTIGDTT